MTQRETQRQNIHSQDMDVARFTEKGTLEEKDKKQSNTALCNEPCFSQSETTLPPILSGTRTEKEYGGTDWP